MIELNLDDHTHDPHMLRALGHVLGTYAAYAHLKADAMEARLQGDIQDAKRFETRCESLYAAIPPEYQW